MDNGVDTFKKGTGWVADTTGDAASYVAEGGEKVYDSIASLFKGKEE